MKFFIDNNLSVQLANGMRAFGEDVVHLTDMFPAETEDVTWLQEIGAKEIYLVTRDEGVRRHPNELLAIKQHRVGAFFLGGKSRNRCELIQQLVRSWPRMKALADSTRRPFIFRVPPSGTKFVPLQLD